MASGWTNRGKFKVLDIIFRGAAPPTTFYVALVTAAVPPTADTNTLGELTQIANGNGYATNGIAVARNSTDWDTLTEDDTSDLGKVLLKDVTWIATGGALPASGAGPSYAVLTDDNATPANRLVYAWWDLAGPLSVTVGQPLGLQDSELRLT